jgi:threonylcarbamoyladenosine tRNA methylthiotransferase MtaB
MRRISRLTAMKVCFDTFGCRLNRAEALQEEAKFLDSGWSVTRRHADADLIVIRGCSITARAQRDCEKHIARLKEKYPATRLLVQGCLPETLKTALPGKWDAAGSGKKEEGTENEEPLPKRTARAYLKVQDGCNCRCTFCIVPRFRGRSVSEPFDKVIDKARRFIDAGYREIVVTGCNLSLYSSQGRGFAELATALAGLGGARIRIGSLEPGSAALETVHAMAEKPSICRFLHLSVQSASESVLASMKRPYRAKDVDHLVREALRLMPDIRLGCDIITGFPGEMDIDHLSTRGFLMRFPFTNAHIFPYSERPGTPAASFQNAITKEIRRARARELAGISSRALARYAKKFVGRAVDIVIEDKNSAAGWTGEYLWCEAVGAQPPPRKSIANVHVISAGADGKLKGRIIGHGG